MEGTPQGPGSSFRANIIRVKTFWEIGLHLVSDPSITYGGNQDMTITIGSGAHEDFRHKAEGHDVPTMEDPRLARRRTRGLHLRTVAFGIGGQFAWFRISCPTGTHSFKKVPSEHCFEHLHEAFDIGGRLDGLL